MLSKEVKKGNSDKPKSPKFLRPAAESTAQLAALLEPIVDVTKCLLEELLSIASHLDVEPLIRQSTFFSLVLPILVECWWEAFVSHLATLQKIFLNVPSVVCHV